ncbi:MAG: 2-phospho-L-lactate guanylyltransferase [Panacagrimonas sp.]
MWAVVPLKPPSLAKSRLAAVLTPDQRRTWFFHMAQRAIDALRATRGVERVVVITADAEVARFAQQHGAMVLAESRADGTSQAFATALAQLRSPSLRGVLMMAGDLPLVSSRALETLVDAASRHEVVIVPDRLQRGTNALVCSPADAIPPCFGDDSYARHLAAARAARRSYCTLQLEALALDIDVPADIERLYRDHAGLTTGLPLPAEVATATRDAA